MKNTYQNTKFVVVRFSDKVKVWPGDGRRGAPISYNPSRLQMHNRQFNPPTIICKTNFFRCRIRAVGAFQQRAVYQSNTRPPKEKRGVFPLAINWHILGPLLFWGRLGPLLSPRAHHPSSSPLCHSLPRYPLPPTGPTKVPKLSERKKFVRNQIVLVNRKLADWEARVPMDNVGVGVGHLVGGGVLQQHHGGGHLPGSRWASLMTDAEKHSKRNRPLFQEENYLVQGGCPSNEPEVQK